MALKSSGRKYSFEILNGSSSVEDDRFLSQRSNSDPIEKVSTNRKKKKHKKKKPTLESDSVIREDPNAETSFTDSNSVQNGNLENGNVFLENSSSNFIAYGGQASVVCTVSDVTEVAECHSLYNNNVGELRQRNVSNGGGGGEEEMQSSSLVEEKETEESRVEVEVEVEVSSVDKQWRSEPNGSVVPTAKLESAESLDWNRLMAEDPNCK